eukprot:SAG31_NODE_43779_length_265_cov_1.216867_1_plen_44_part_01
MLGKHTAALFSQQLALLAPVFELVGLNVYSLVGFVGSQLAPTTQ